MRDQLAAEPRWAAVTIWAVVNALNLLQGVGFLSRVLTGSLAFNHLLGYLVILLALPSVVAAVAMVKSKTVWIHWLGTVLFLLFVIVLVLTDYVLHVEFRSPARPGVLVPFLVLFFGSILLMGLPMFWLNRQLWLVTVATTAFLLGSMGFAMQKGVG